MASSSGSRLSVGVTIGLRAEMAPMWANGIMQSAIYLADALKRCPNVGRVTLVNTTPLPVPDQLPWDVSLWPTAMFDDVSLDLDVVIELGGQLDAERTARLHARGGKLVSCCCGDEYVQAMQAIIFDRPLWGAGLFVNREYDDVWVMPNVAATSAGFFSTLRRRPAKVVPFVWDPVFVDAEAASVCGGGLYSPREGPRRVGVMEPNLDVGRFCFYPALIADEAYRRRPEAISLLQVAHSTRIATESQEFISLMNQLDLVRDGKAAFIGSASPVRLLSSGTDVLVSHQWGDPIGFLHLEACWLGYPLVHNGDLCSDLGYYYSRNDLDGGCAKLLDAIETHDSDTTYRERQRRLIDRFRPTHPALVRTYADLLEAVVAP
jgi:hypothetical protein